MELRTHVSNTLDALGISRRYLGYELAADAICLLVEDERSFRCICGSLFLRVADQHHCSRQQVERNLRTVIRHAWTVNAGGLRQLAAYPLSQEPTVSEFVEIVALFVLRERQRPAC